MWIGALIAVATLTLTGIAVACKRTVIFVSAGIFWLLLGFWAVLTSTITWDIYFFVFIACIAMLIAMTTEAIVIWDDERKVEKRKIEEENIIESKATLKEQSTMHPADRLRLKHGLGVSETRIRRQNKFKTGW
jgi:uncharacterized membrane protein